MRQDDTIDKPICAIDRDMLLDYFDNSNYATIDDYFEPRYSADDVRDIVFSLPLLQWDDNNRQLEPYCDRQCNKCSWQYFCNTAKEKK